MRILITGVTGFVGKNLAISLTKIGHQVWGIDNFFNSDESCLIEQVSFIKVDISDKCWRDQFSNIDIDVIVHLAAQSSGEISFQQPEYDLDSNIKGAMQVCLFAKENNVKKIVFASSMSVYGEVQGVVEENDETIPLSLYAVGKKSSEDYLRIFSRQYGFEVVNLRLFNIYGNGQNMKNLAQGMVSIFLAQLLSEQPFILVKGGLERYRDFIHVYDVVKVFNHFIGKEIEPGRFETFNVGTATKTTVVELITMLQQTFKISKKIVVEGATLGDQSGILANNKKLLKECDINFIELEEGLKIWRSSFEQL